jgi:hypothetical protein
VEDTVGKPARWELEVLDSGRCEPLKAAVHGVLLATMAVCAAYNSAAWVKRRQRHLAINAILYTAGVWWERCHVVHHLAPCAHSQPSAPQAPPIEDLSDAA